MNSPGLASLYGYLESGRAIAFLGAGASTPLYPLWDALIGELVDAVADRLTAKVARTYRTLAKANPDAVVEMISRNLGQPAYREVLRDLFRVRRDEETNQTWTPVHAAVVRCSFAGIVTTNYDHGIMDARLAARPTAPSTGFASWTNEDALDRWRTGDVFGDGELPVLFAHGHQNEPDHIVLGTTNYQRAYAGKLRRVLDRLFDQDHLVWIGFGFADQVIGAILREVVAGGGPAATPGTAPRHVAILPWDPAKLDPMTVRDVMEIRYGCQVVLYPAPSGHHGALPKLLHELADPGIPAPTWPPTAASPPARASSPPPMTWVHGGEPVDNFTGRAAELARLDRWAADPEVRLVGVTAWGGAGKTALVTEWLARRHGTSRRPVAGMFAWSFYEEPSAEVWAEALVAWAEASFGLEVSTGRPADRVLAVARAVPMLLVLDGLEVVQEGPSGAEFGRLLDGVLRDALTGLCEIGDGLVVLTSRFPFADLSRFAGTAARLLDVPPFSPEEGAELLASAGGDWLPDDERRDLVRAVNGHALAVGVLASALAERPPTAELATLRADLVAAARTDERVGKVLRFYADRLAPPDRMLVALVAMFSRPVPAATVLTLGRDETLDAPLAGWTTTQVEQACARLAGLLTWHADGTISAHPLVRDAFRPLALSGGAAELARDVALADLPAGEVSNRADALRVVEMVELLLDAGEWTAADDMYRNRLDNGQTLQTLPANPLGLRCATAFVTSGREKHCRRELSEKRLAFYLNEVGLFAMNGGDFPTAIRFISASNELDATRGDDSNVAIGLENAAACFCAVGHPAEGARAAASALGYAVAADNRQAICGSHGDIANAHDLAGATVAAERSYTTSRLEDEPEPRDSYLLSMLGAEWGDFLVRTRRLAAARRLADRNVALCELNGWADDVARYRRLLGRCDLIDGDLASAGAHLVAALATFRDGDMVLELVSTLPDLAEHQRRTGDLDEAARTCGEAIGLAGPRELVAAQARALVVRAKVRGDQGAVEPARDDADAAFQLSTVSRQLPWQELGALDAHAYLDALESVDRGWRARTNELRARLIPPGLDPDPFPAAETEE